VTFQRVMRRRLTGLLGVALGSLVALVLLGLPILEAIFGRQEFGPGEIRQLWMLLLALGGVWVGGSAGQILATAFYAQGDTRTPVRIGAIGFTLATLLKVPGFFLFGIWGVAITASLQYLTSAAVQYVLLDRRLVAGLAGASAARMVRDGVS
jgi:putative peptidoglycan lipid II flippase